MQANANAGTLGGGFRSRLGTPHQLFRRKHIRMLMEKVYKKKAMSRMGFDKNI
jgi:hypothetical protein